MSIHKPLCPQTRLNRNTWPTFATAQMPASSQGGGRHQQLWVLVRAPQTHRKGKMKGHERSPALLYLS